MKIGKAIKTLRDKKGFSQSELADRIGLTQTSLSQIETGAKNPSEKSLEKIAQALDSSVAFIKLASVDIETDVPEDQREVFNELFPDFIERMEKLLAKQ